MAIEAITEAQMEGRTFIDLNDFAAVYFARTDCDDGMNPFMTPHWRGIDTTKALAREDEKVEPPKSRRRSS